jgi:hypothetical protein
MKKMLFVAALTMALALPRAATTRELMSDLSGERAETNRQWGIICRSQEGPRFMMCREAWLARLRWIDAQAEVNIQCYLGGLLGSSSNETSQCGARRGQLFHARRAALELEDHFLRVMAVR